jgi:hypothetical protein
MEKEPKIVQVIGTENGAPETVLYDNGRVFYFIVESMQWQKLCYPIPRIPIPPATARIGRRGRKQTK